MSDPWQDDVPQGRFDLAQLRRLWPFVRPYRREFACCLLILVVSFLLELAGPMLVQWAIDGPLANTAAAAPDRLRALVLACAGFLAVTGLGAVLGYRYGMLTAWNGQRVIRDVRSFLFTHLLHVGPSFHERNPAGKLTTRVSSDVENLNELIATGVLQSVFDLLKIGGVLVALFLLDVRLALFTVATTPVVIGISIAFRAAAQRAYRSVRGKLARQNGYTAEVIGGVRATRAFHQEDAVAARYRELNHDTTQSWLATVRHFSLFFSAVDLAIRGTSIGLLWFGGLSVLDGALTPGDFVKFWLWFGMLAAPIKELGEKYNVLQAAFASTERIVQILAEPRFPPAGPPAPPPPPRGPAAVEFAAVDFRYRDDQPVLDQVSFRAEPGQTIAIVGPTGAGKSTVLALVSRLREVAAGSVRVADRDVRDWPVGELRRRVAVVAQDLFLFTGTVLDNVRLFDPRIGEDAVRRALAIVGADTFVAALPQGLLEPVQERGATFSQGQRQLLAFARALVTDPDVLVLDEATASIDSATESRLQQALAAALRGRTALVVAHRLSTVRSADQILVLERGKIVERGNHGELVQRDGAYARMLRAAEPPT